MNDRAKCRPLNGSFASVSNPQRGGVRLRLHNREPFSSRVRRICRADLRRLTPYHPSRQNARQVSSHVSSRVPLVQQLKRLKRSDIDGSEMHLIEK